MTATSLILRNGTLKVDSDSSILCSGSGDLLNMTLQVTVRTQPSSGSITVVLVNTTAGTRLPSLAFNSVTVIYDLRVGQNVCVLRRGNPIVNVVGIPGIS